MKKLSNYCSIKKQGYAFYNLTCCLDEELRNQLLENNLARFSSDDEAKVFINTVLYPFDSVLYARLLASRDVTYDLIAQELNIDVVLIREKFHEYSINHFQDFLSEFGIRVDTSVEKEVKKAK